MSTEETQQAEGTEETQQVSEESTIEQDIEKNLKEPEDNLEVTDDIESDIEVTDEEIEAELKASQQEALEPNPRWDKRYKEVFNEWGELERGRDYQKAMLDLYNEVQGYATQTEQERAHWRKFAEPLQQALEPYQQMFAMTGQTPDQAVRQALSLVTRLSQDPRATIMGLAQRAGINLQELVEGQPYVDPGLQEAREEIRRMRHEQRQREEYQARQYQQRMVADIEQQLHHFHEAKDEQGKPKYPHVDLVETEMATLIRGNPQISLEDAYLKACKLSDEVTQAEESRERAKDAARKAAKAKKEALAAKRVSGRPGVDTPPEEPLEETIRKEYRRNSQAA